MLKYFHIFFCLIISTLYVIPSSSDLEQKIFNGRSEFTNQEKRVLERYKDIKFQSTNDTPLHFAADTKTAQALITIRGTSDLFKHNKAGQTPFHQACFRLHNGLASYYLNCGADINAKTGKDTTGSHERNYQDTPLHILVVRLARVQHNTHGIESAISLIKLLVASGVKTNVKNSSNETPEDIAKRMNVHPIYQQAVKLSKPQATIKTTTVPSPSWSTRKPENFLAAVTGEQESDSHSTAFSPSPIDSPTVSENQTVEADEIKTEEVNPLQLTFEQEQSLKKALQAGIEYFNNHPEEVEPRLQSFTRTKSSEQILHNALTSGIEHFTQNPNLLDF